MQNADNRQHDVVFDGPGVAANSTDRNVGRDGIKSRGAPMRCTPGDQAMHTINERIL